MSLLFSLHKPNLLQKSKQYFEKTKNLGRSYVFCTNYKHNYIKRAVPNLQKLLINYCTKDQKYFQENNTDIYTGVFNSQIRKLKIISFGTSICGLAIQPVLILKATTIDSTLGLVGAITIAIFSVTSPLLLNLITKRYVTRVCYDAKGEKYTAVTYDFFLRQNKIEFTPADVRVPEVTGLFTTCFIKNQPVLIDECLFNDNKHYLKIMGLDKPLDYKLSNVSYNDMSMQDLSKKSVNKTNV